MGLTLNVKGNVSIGQYIETQYINTYNDYRGNHRQQAEQTVECDAVDVEPVDTSFFCLDRFSQEIIERELTTLFRLASSKADACRRLRQSETLGYIRISPYTNDKKAELMNRYQSRFRFTGEDFKKS